MLKNKTIAKNEAKHAEQYHLQFESQRQVSLKAKDKVPDLMDLYLVNVCIYMNIHLHSKRLWITSQVSTKKV